MLIQISTYTILQNQLKSQEMYVDQHGASTRMETTEKLSSP